MELTDKSDSEVFLDYINPGGGIALAAIVVVHVLHLVVNFDVELDFGFSSGGTDRNLGAFGGEELKNVGCGGEVHLGYVAGSDVGAVEVGIVLDDGDWCAAEFLGRILAEAFHHGLDFFGAGLAGTYNRYAYFAAETVFQIYFLEHAVEVESAVLCPCAYFGH